MARDFEKKKRKKSWLIVRPFLFIVRLFTYDIEDKDQVSNQLLWIIVLAFSSFLVWAYIVEIDKVVSATAKAYPYEKLQTVEHYEGGRVNIIHVKKGSIVERGDLLITLSPIQTAGELTIQTDTLAELTVRQARLLAEFENNDSFSIPENIEALHSDLVRQERAIFKEKQRRRINELEGRQADLQSARAILSAAEIGLKTSVIEYKTMELLYKKGLEPELSFIKAENVYAEAISTKEQAAQEVVRVQAEIDRAIRDQQTEILEELAQVRSDLTKARENIRIAADKVDRSELRSPIRGMVNNVLVSTVGGTVKPGEAVVEIVPENSQIVVEALIAPADIGFIERGQEALVKITAYDYSIFGSLQGQVDVIPADTTIDEELNQPFYEVTVKLNQEYKDPNGKSLKIIPGMEAQVDIIVGKRNAMEYILSPLMRVTQESLREK